MILKIAFSLLGLAALTIGGMIFTIGPDAAGQTFVALLRMIAPATPPLTGLGGANIDSELRFYSVFWMAYGGLALWVAQALPARIAVLRLMLVIFWLGGFGRALSYVMLGAPHPLFVALMWIEIALPPALAALSHQRTRVSRE